MSPQHLKPPLPGQAADFILEAESKYELGRIAIQGTTPWNLIRFTVQRALLEKLGVQTPAHSRTSGISRGKALIRGTANGALFGPRARHACEILVVGHSRRVQVGVKTIDPYVDPILPALEQTATILDPATRSFKHLPRESNGKIVFLDQFQLAGSTSYSAAVPLEPGFAQLTVELKKAFGLDLDIHRIAQHRMKRFTAQRKVAARWLDCLKPKVLVLVVSYGMEALIHEAQLRQIPTVELQHGLIGPNHLAYHFPEGRSRLGFADWFFTFGTHWPRVCSLPVPKTRVCTTGFPHLSHQQASAGPPVQNNQILFLSQGPFNRSLEPIILEAMESLPLDLEILVRLHPGEESNWKSRYPKLYRKNVPVVNGSETSLYEQMSRAVAVAGVHSTAMYEAYVLGKPVIALPSPGITDLDPLIEAGIFQHAEDGRALAAAASKTARPDIQIGNTFFEPTRPEDVLTALNVAMERGA